MGKPMHEKTHTQGTGRWREGNQWQKEMGGGGGGAEGRGGREGGKKRVKTTLEALVRTKKPLLKSVILGRSSLVQCGYADVSERIRYTTTV